MDTRFVEFLPDADGAWLAGTAATHLHDQTIGADVARSFGSFRVRTALPSLTSYPPIDGATVTAVAFTPVYSFNFDFALTLSDDRLRRVYWPNRNNLFAPTLRNPYDYCNAMGVIVQDGDHPTPATIASAGVTDSSEVVESVTVAWEFPEAFSDEGAAEAAHVVARGVTAYPCTVDPTGARRLQLWADLGVPVA